MAKDLEQLILTMSADLRRFEKALDNGQKKFNKTAREIEKRQAELDKNLAKLGSAAGAGLGKLSLAAGVAFGALTGYAVKAAADASEVQNAFEVAFGSSAKSAQAFAETLANDVGRSVTDLQGGMSRMQLVLTGMGVAAEKAAELTQALTQRGVDIGSLWNVSDAEALQAIVSGLSGETEPLKRFGAVISEAQVKAELLRLGFKGNAEQASEAAKAIARTNLILNKTTSAAGDAAKTAESTSNQFKRAQSEFKDAAISLGQQLLPAITEVTSKTADLIEEFSKLPNEVKLGGLALLGLVAVSGPIAGAIAGLIKLIDYANKARTALAGIAAAKVGGDAAAATGLGLAAGGALAGSVAAPFIGAGAIVASALNEGQLRRIGAKPAEFTQDQVEAARATVLRRLESMAKSDTYSRDAQGRVVARPNANEGARRQLSQAQALLAKFEADLKLREAAATKAAKDEANAALQGNGTFGLPPGLDRPGVADSNAGKKAAAEAKRKAAEAERLRQQELDREDRTARMIASADEDLLRARQAVAVEAQDRLKLELEGIDRERQARRYDLDLAVQQKELTKGQAERVDLAEEAARQQREANARAETAAIVEREAADIEAEIRGQQMDLLGIRISLSDTVEERRDLELQLLALQQDERRRALQAVIDDETLSKAKRDAARKLMGGLTAIEEGEKKSVIAANLTPLEQWRKQSLSDAAEVRTAFETIAVSGLNSLNAGITETILNAENMGQAFSRVAKQIAADLVSVAVRRSITEPLANILFPSGGGGFLAKGFSKIAGFAGGTNFAPGGLSIVGERGPELVNLPRGAQVIPNHLLNGLANMQGPSGVGRAVQAITFDNRGAVIWESEVSRMMAYADNAAATAAIHSYQAARRDIPARMGARGANRLGR